MGKAVIISEQGKGEYVIQVTYDIARAENRLVILDRETPALSIEINALKSDLSGLLSERDTLVEDMNTKIDEANAATSNNKDFSNAFKAILAKATKAITAVNAEIVSVSNQLSAKEYELTTKEKEIADIDRLIIDFGNPQNVSAWCGDYTLQLTDEVETIEINDETNGPNDQPIIITPTGTFTDPALLAQLNEELLVLEDELADLKTELAVLLTSVITDPVAISAKHDEINAKESEIDHKRAQIDENGTTQIQPVLSSGAWGILYNKIAMPGYQRWKPRFRAGKISNLDVAADTCTVAFNEEYEFSSIEGDVHFFGEKYSIFQTPSIDDVPVDYMFCNAAAFTDGDYVIVSFNRDWETPKVIGFVQNPVLCAQYMESGFLLVPAPASEDVSTVHYNKAIQNYMDLTSLPMQGLCFPDAETGVFEGQDLLDGFESNTVAENPHRVLPSSVFSGKLQLMVQAIYGTDRADFEVKTDSNGDPEGITIGGFSILFGFDTAYGLVTTSAYTYFLVEVGDGTITHYPIKLNAMSELFAKKLADPELSYDEETTKKIEAYVLSSATIDIDNLIVGSTYEAIGRPWWYSWHWSWDGKEGEALLAEADPGNTQYNTRRYVVKVNHHFVNVNVGTPEEPIIEVQDRFENSVELREQGVWWPSNDGLNVIRPWPKEGEDEMFTVLPVKNIHGSVSKLNPLQTPMNNVLVYLYRDKGDNIIECRYSQDVSIDNSTTSITYAPGCYDDSSPVWTSGSRTAEGESGSNVLTITGVATLTGSIHNHGSYDLVGGYCLGTPNEVPQGRNTESSLWDTSTGNDLMCDHSTRLKDWLLETGYFERKGGAFNFVGPIQGERIWDPSTEAWAGWIGYELRMGGSQVGSVRHQSSKRRKDWSTSMFVEIPFDTCSAVFYGQNQHSEEDEYTETLGNLFDPFNHDVWAYVYQTTPGINGAPNTTHRILGPAPLEYGGVESSTTSESNARQTPFTRDNNIWGAVYKGMATVGIPVVQNETTSKYNVYFTRPYFLDNAVPHIDRMRESTSGAYMYTWAFENSEIYEYAGTSSIGWA